MSTCGDIELEAGSGNRSSSIQCRSRRKRRVPRREVLCFPEARCSCASLEEIRRIQGPDASDSWSRRDSACEETRHNVLRPLFQMLVGSVRCKVCRCCDRRPPRCLCQYNGGNCQDGRACPRRLLRAFSVQGRAGGRGAPGRQSRPRSHGVRAIRMQCHCTQRICTA